MRTPYIALKGQGRKRCEFLRIKRDANLAKGATLVLNGVEAQVHTSKRICRRGILGGHMVRIAVEGGRRR